MLLIGIRTKDYEFPFNHAILKILLVRRLMHVIIKVLVMRIYCDFIVTWFT